MPRASSAAMVAALIMPRSATMQALRIPKRCSSRVTTGRRVVTSAVLPGIRNEAIGRSLPSRTLPSTTWFKVPPVVLRMAPLPQAGAAFALEPQGGGVEEGDRDLAEQGLAVTVKRLLDGVGHGPVLADCLAQPRHRLVRVIQGQIIGARKTQALPPGAGMAIGAGDHQAVHHREIDGPLDVEPELAVCQQFAQHIAAAEVLPQPAKHQIGADAETLQSRKFAAVEAREHDRAAGVPGRGRDQRIQEPRCLDRVTTPQRLDHPLHMAAALASILDEIEILVATDLLDANEHDAAS